MKKQIPNILTVFRVILVPLYTWVVLTDYAWGARVALAIFILASVTDFFDGFLARRLNIVSVFGKFFDPLADKILVAAALVTFVEKGWISAWYVVLILFREFAVSGLRLLAASDNGKVMAAELPGKLKTASTMLSIVVILAFRAHLAYGGGSMTAELHAFDVTANVLMIICTGLTMWSGADYAVTFLRGRRDGVE
ncbi:CDP-diacylglycerol--glycerol-3-phosphate 3-phosphatidyltransferase [Clostridia bacterium]|nr:CDP-diacylglycerol--glycerol-3-phosphate 3-phosphatidyltransferase [Clostridia bacterium]